jgi:hypothetical protein
VSEAERDNSDADASSCFILPLMLVAMRPTVSIPLATTRRGRVVSLYQVSHPARHGAGYGGNRRVHIQNRLSVNTAGPVSVGVKRIDRRRPCTRR